MLQERVYSHIAILADGDFPKHEIPLERLALADAIICCDGSVIKLERFTSLHPTWIVGDMDTLNENDKIRLKEIIIHNPDQETNDLTKAFNFALTHSPKQITILGATGGREDHTLGNISLLADYSDSIANIEMITDSGIFTAYSDSCTVESRPGEQVSIFTFDPTLKIKSAGLKYPTDQVLFDRWWKATLNESSEERFSLELSHPAKIILFRNF